ncbi:MAG: metal-dependent transcriptional regulator [Actinobacteria bacterium]|nr:metal-dependent transcriptional regulator [Actinomycetota bacterium]MBU1493415.1 metal-dependent transcriptional regulator [Actinomycetota bacterium]MBU1864883.1 metal-dependent transcriptional regulator [Actinomycetota bacterium]
MGVNKIPSAHRDYLQAIFALEEGGIPAIQARIGDWLGVSRASVSEMVRKLQEEGMIAETTGAVGLTEAGRVLAESVVRRHRLAERFLSDLLRLPWVTVHAEAAAWEHVISHDVEVALREVMGDPKTCPHGNPIPGMGYVAPEMTSISEMQIGQSGTVERISQELEGDLEMMAFLDESGIRPGLVIEVVGRTPHDVMTLRPVGLDPIGLGPFASSRIMVVPG